MSYLTLQPKDIKDTIRRTVKAIRKSGLTFDTIAFRGLSGSLIAPGVAVALRKRLVAIRKGESSHGNPIEHDWDQTVRQYLIVDDIIATGATVDAIQYAMKSKWPSAIGVGIALYRKSSPLSYIPEVTIIDATGGGSNAP